MLATNSRRISRHIFVSLPNRDSLIQRPSSLPLLSHDFTCFCHKLPSGWMEERIIKRLSDFVSSLLPFTSRSFVPTIYGSSGFFPSLPSQNPAFLALESPPNRSLPIRSFSEPFALLNRRSTSFAASFQAENPRWTCSSSSSSDCPSQSIESDPVIGRFPGIHEIEADSEGMGKEGNLWCACCGEDFWSEAGETEEAKITAMAQKVDQFASFIVGTNGMTKNRPKKAVTPLDQNLSKLNKALISVIPQILPSPYHGSSLYNR